MNEHPLIAFLRARLDEDEQMARAAGNRRWLVQDNIIELYPEREDDGFISWPTRADARHAANWDPARVLADIASKRKILDLHRPEPFRGGPHLVCVPCSGGGPQDYYVTDWPCQTLYILAEPFASHPDYPKDQP